MSNLPGYDAWKLSNDLSDYTEDDCTCTVEYEDGEIVEIIDDFWCVVHGDPIDQEEARREEAELERYEYEREEGFR